MSRRHSDRPTTPEIGAIKPRVRTAFARRARGYADHDCAQRLIAAHLFAELDRIGPTANLPAANLAPWLLDAGCGVGRDLPELARRYPERQIVALDAAAAMVAAISHTGVARVAGDLEALPLASQSIALYWSNCAWQWTTPERTVSEMARILAPHGWAVVSVVLPGSLPELAAAFTALDEPPPFAPLPDLPLWEQALTTSAWARLTLQVRDHRLTFATPHALLASVRGVGATATPATATPFQRDRHRRLLAALEAFRTAEGIPLTYRILTVLAQRR